MICSECARKKSTRNFLPGFEAQRALLTEFKLQATNSTIPSWLTADPLLMHSKEVQGGVIFKLICKAAASQAGAKR